MKRLFTSILAALGLSSACGQQNFENADVQGFAAILNDPATVLLDVRTIEEFTAGHLEGSINIDQSKSDFLEKAKSLLPKDKKIAIYCRSGRRSANAAGKLAHQGYQCVNLKGGILAWQAVGLSVTTNNYEVDVFATPSGKTIKFHALMHASIRIEYDGKEIEIDPVTKLGDRTIDFKRMPKADYLFVTHEHGDHFDKEALNILSDAHTQLVMNQRCTAMYGSGKAMVNGEQIQLSDDITLEAVPAYNTTEGRLQFHPKGRDNGYILSIDGVRIYIAGDTEDIPEMESIKDIDIAFLPCNQPYTMTADQLVRAAKVVKPKVLFPYHYGQTDVTTIPTLLKDEGIDVRIRHYE